jgi:hypothetical protein
MIPARSPPEEVVVVDRIVAAVAIVLTWHICLVIPVVMELDGLIQIGVDTGFGSLSDRHCGSVPGRCSSRLHPWPTPARKIAQVDGLPITTDLAAVPAA